MAKRVFVKDAVEKPLKAEGSRWMVRNLFSSRQCKGCKKKIPKGATVPVVVKNKNDKVLRAYHHECLPPEKQASMLLD